MTKTSIVPYDSIVIGAGPAGITAAIYLARKNLDILVLTLDIGGQARLSTDVENYTGFTLISGEELVERFEEHLKAFGIKIVEESVRSVEKQKNLFKIRTAEKVYWSKSVILASGKKPRMLKVPGEEKIDWERNCIQHAPERALLQGQAGGCGRGWQFCHAGYHRALQVHE